MKRVLSAAQKKMRRVVSAELDEKENSGLQEELQVPHCLVVLKQCLMDVLVLEEEEFCQAL